MSGCGVRTRRRVRTCSQCVAGARVDAVRDAAADGGVVDSCMYAEISCEACNFAEDLEGEMTQPRSQFTLPVRCFA